VVAVGGEVSIMPYAMRSFRLIVLKDKRVHIHSWNGSTLTETRVLPESEGTITAVAVSSDGTLIVQGNVSVQ
jgi:hypothetical protein